MDKQAFLGCQDLLESDEILLTRMNIYPDEEHSQVGLPSYQDECSKMLLQDIFNNGQNNV
jgi:hypothetical protein